MTSNAFNPDTDIPSLAGKVIFITGGKHQYNPMSISLPLTTPTGTAGLGAGSIAALAKHDPAHIFFSGRNEKSATRLISSICATIPNANLTFFKCDISSLASVQECARLLTSQTTRLDILMLNAGIMATPPSTSADGYEIQFATNQLGHSLLVKLLLPVLQSTSKLPGADVRVINMTSIAYKQAPSQGIDFATLKTDQANLGLFGKWARYGQSKLAQLLYTDELARRYPEITWVSVHPGYIFTGLFDGASFLTKLPVLIMSIGSRTPVEKGHFAQCWAATAPKVVSGGYYEPIGVEGKRATALARDRELAGRLWEWTQDELKGWN
jgi:NAD(P)-dependent dehydrogenase (short-subunit alcohol dehydrogenase family)